MPGKRIKYTEAEGWEWGGRVVNGSQGGPGGNFRTSFVDPRGKSEEGIKWAGKSARGEKTRRS